MIRILLFLLFLLFLLCFTSSAFAYDAVSLGKINSGMSKSKIIDVLGEPLSVTPEGGMVLEKLNYPNYEIYFASDNLISIETKSKSICTPEKICPGIKTSEATLKYGKPSNKEMEGVNYLEFYVNTGLYCWYRMLDRQGFIKTIEIACQP
ncbi:MAG: hypothetical protein V7785_20365 [Bermanella sp.]